MIKVRHVELPGWSMAAACLMPLPPPDTYITSRPAQLDQLAGTMHERQQYQLLSFQSFSQRTLWNRTPPAHAFS